MNVLQEKGSLIAKAGFQNEKDVSYKFNNWQNDEQSQQWLTIMGYDLQKIDFVKAVILHGFKADINLQIQIKYKPSFTTLFNGRCCNYSKRFTKNRSNWYAKKGWG